MAAALVIEAPLPQRSQQLSPFQMSGGLCPAVPAYGAVAVEAAEQDAATLRSRVAQDCQHPAEIAWIADGAFEGDEDLLERRKGAAFNVTHKIDVDVAERLRNCFDVRGFVSIGAGRQRAVEAMPRHAGERGKSPVLLAERAGGERTHRRRIQPAGDEAADGMGASELPAYGLIETASQPVRIRLVGR